MRSQYGDYFNHDEDAPTYDAEVAEERDPIRTGYRSALRWVGECTTGCAYILDLGAGTGNTIVELPMTAEVVAVDISKAMLALARNKLKGRRVRYVQQDLLQYVDDAGRATFEAIVSSYTIHHLTEVEKEHLFQRSGDLLTPTGRMVLVDLMYQDAGDKGKLLKRYRENWQSVVDGLTEEFFWDISKAIPAIRSAGYEVTLRRFSDLSWGVLAQRK